VHDLVPVLAGHDPEQDGDRFRSSGEVGVYVDIFAIPGHKREAFTPSDKGPIWSGNHQH